MASKLLVGLDVGTCSIKAAVAEHKNGKLILHSIFKEPSAGLRRGAIFDLGEAMPAIARVLENVKRTSRGALKNVFVNISTPQVKAQTSRGIVAVSRVDNEIYQDDIDRVVKASQAVNVTPNHIIIHNITREYIVDGVPDIENPLGLSGSRLEVSSFIIDAFAPHVKNLMRAVEMAGGEVGGMVFSPLVAARAALSKNQKNLGAAVIDIGFATTGLAVYEEGKLVGLKMFPLGSSHVTNDLAVGLKIPVAAAESLKLHHGHAFSEDMSSKDAVDLKKFHPDAKGSVSRRFIAEIIESRLAEILEFAHNELKALGKGGRLAGGVVFTGGGAKIPGLTQLGKQELKLSSQVGFTIGTDLFEEATIQAPEALEDPEYVSAMGLVLWGADSDGWTAKKSSQAGFRNLFKYFLP